MMHGQTKIKFTQNNNEAQNSIVSYYQLVLPCRWLIALYSPESYSHDYTQTVQDIRRQTEYLTSRETWHVQ